MLMSLFIYSESTKIFMFLSKSPAHAIFISYSFLKINFTNTISLDPHSCPLT